MISTSAGVDSVTFTAVSDPDDGTLTYAIYRDGGRTPIAIRQGDVLALGGAGAALPGRGRQAWFRPHLRGDGQRRNECLCEVAGLGDGHRLLDEPGAQLLQDRSRRQAVVLLAAERALGHDRTLTPRGNGFTGIYEPGTTQGVPGPITGDPATATAFDGHSGLVTSAGRVAGPGAFSIEGWFKTSSNTGGKLIGFGSSQTGMSLSYDRHVYLMNDGQLVFGVFNHGLFTIETPRVYNDGHWHYVVATLDPTAGMALYVDGQLIGTNPTTPAQSLQRLLAGRRRQPEGPWNLDYWKTNSQGTTEPNSYYVSGDIGDVAVYPYALSAARVAAHYAANALSH